MIAKVAEPEPKVVKAPEQESEVKESKVEDLPNETLKDLLADTTIKLVPSWQLKGPHCS